jgi:hypothetical protein
MFQVQKVWGVSQDTVRRRAQKGEINILKNGRCSVVRNEDMKRLFFAPCGAECGAEK